MKTFKDTKHAESEVKKLLNEHNTKIYGIHIEPFNRRTHYIDININNISLYGLQCLSELLGDTNPTIVALNEQSITIGSIFKIE